MEIFNNSFTRSWTHDSMAQELWKKDSMTITEQTQARVQSAEIYLSRLGFELKGVLSDGNCFFYAFYESYKTIKHLREIPLIDCQENPPKFLRETLASLFTNVSGNEHLKDEIEQDGVFVTASQGAHLAHHFKVHLRVITPGETGEVADLLNFPEVGKKTQTWETIPEAEKLKTYIFIVDLGGHFVYAVPKSYPLQGRAFQLLFLLGACFIIYQISKRIFQKNR